ncbi:hypothetical protein DFJ58DRAFT_717036 [Suillus subalutaceus]|uniref:uncharacterized protein n=1 Tax=Suillus subalutaceus TaxID=48586 RepID=UPI001B887155|nr:uncharacterized protein DFJ58DRAFT_717036 [Suillus subalutaceus]KAG1848751.1 hypothetical protein DFJ58DRAFT_717036 [Suillus subalutaceus]
MSMPEKFTLKKLYDLNGLIALVTGGGTGIGVMIARGLAANGAKEVLDRVVSEWNATKGDDMGPMIAHEMDVTKKDSIKAGVTRIAQADGRLHILEAGPLSEYLFNNESFEEWSSLYSINTFSIYFVTVAFLDLLDNGSKNNDKEGFSSSVINITSMSGLLKIAQRHFCYNSSKAAGSHLTRMLSTEFSLKGINVRVNAIAPGVYESELTYDVISGQAATDEVGMPVLSIPAKRPGTAAEMAGTAVYLASPAGAYMNGQELVIDGGCLAVNPARV